MAVERSQSHPREAPLKARTFLSAVAGLCIPLTGCAPTARDAARAPADTTAAVKLDYPADSAGAVDLRYEAIARENILAAEDLEIRSFFSELEVFREPLAIPPWAEGDQAWNAYAGPVQAADNVDLTVLFRQALTSSNGVRITEGWDGTGRVTGIGHATCNGTRPVIVYNPASARRLTSLSFLWFRQHERAHHLRLHVVCRVGDPVFQTGINWERDADCEALSQLAEIGSIARDIRMAASERFYLLDMPESLTHPSGRERGHYIRAGEC